MFKSEENLLKAIKKILWNPEIDFPVDTDWYEVLVEADRQAVLGLAAAASPSEIQNIWKNKTSRVTANFFRILYEQSNLYKLMQDNQIPMVILKGCAAAIYYPNPSLRSMGDIDYLIPINQFDRAKEVLKQNGYIILDNTKYKRHIHISKNNISFEQHRFFSYDGIDIEKYITDGMSVAEENVIYGNDFPMLPKLANGLVLLAHMVQHLKTGLGLRQVIDWMMYVNAELDDTFWNVSFHEAVIETGLEKVSVTMTRLCQIYLGLSDNIHWCKDADDKLCGELLDSILSSGNFNRKREDGGAIEKTTTSISRKGLFSYLQTAGEYNWAAYQKHRWLKPFAWIYQIGRYARQGFHVFVHRDNRLFIEDFKRGTQRTKLLRKLDIL